MLAGRLHICTRPEEVARAAQSGGIRRLANVAFFLLIGTVLTVTGYYPEKRKAARLLTTAFEQKE
jgi:hypothetical protein